MTIETICEKVEATIICGEESKQMNVIYSFASDLMSDVLTLECDSLLLITGLCNMQTIRTAEIADIHCILFVRDKRPTKEMIELAKENQVVILCTSHSMFLTSGILYGNGLKSIY